MADIDVLTMVVMLSCLALLTGMPSVFTMTHCRRTSTLLTPVNISCVYVDFQFITCSWSLEEENGNKNCNYSLNTDESVEVHFVASTECCSCESERANYQPNFCQEAEPTKCSWQYMSIQGSEWLEILVTLRNDKSDQIKTCSKQMQLQDIVKPSPVKLSLTRPVKLSLTRNYTEGECLLAERSLLQYTYTCNLTTSVKRKMTSKIFYIRDQSEAEVCELEPDITVITVSCRFISVEREIGFWSDPSSIIISTPADDIPSLMNMTKIIFSLIICCVCCLVLLLCIFVYVRKKRNKDAGPPIYYRRCPHIKYNTDETKTLLPNVLPDDQNKHLKVHVENKYSELLPLDAEPIAANVELFPTDILQGKSIFFGNGPNDDHRDLKIGLGIHAYLKNDEAAGSPIYYRRRPHIKYSTDETKPLLPNVLPDDQNKHFKVESWPPNYITADHSILPDELFITDTLPEDEYLQALCRRYGRQSDLVKSFCKNICKIIKREIKPDENANIWPAWNQSSNAIYFVLETKTLKEIPKSLPTTLRIILNCRVNTSEKESRKVLDKEKEIMMNLSDDDIRQLKLMQQCISKCSGQLMKKHKNITAIFPSVVRSVDYHSSDQHKLIKQMCVSIHVENKYSGLLPLDAEPIAANVELFPTDIVQGKSIFFGKGPNDYHRDLKIGLGIHADLKNDEGNVLVGSLGCFVKNPIHDICCITSAHIIYPKLHDLPTVDHSVVNLHIGRHVFQPAGERSVRFGSVVAAAYNEGNGSSPGYEVALIKISQRHPLSGSFPDGAFDGKRRFIFNSGNVADASLLKPSTEVYKFGMETGPTTGVLGTTFADVRYKGDIVVRNQIQIFPKDKAFAYAGDSGSSVFIGFSKPGTEAVIGLVTGGDDSGRVYVAPIHDVLRAVNCPPYLYRFENSNDSGIYLPNSQNGNEEDQMDTN